MSTFEGRCHETSTRPLSILPFESSEPPSLQVDPVGVDKDGPQHSCVLSYLLKSFSACAHYLGQCLLFSGLSEVPRGGEILLHMTVYTGADGFGHGMGKS